MQIESELLTAKALETITWSEHGESHTAVWHSESNQAQPKWIEVIGDQTKANDAYRLASEGCGMVYRGDYQNAKQLLQALGRRIDKKPLKKANTMLETFHLHRAKQIQRANILNRILLVVEDGELPLRRAPVIKEAIEQALGESLPSKLMISLRALLGMIGAYEWRKKGVFIAALDDSIHPYYGVYSPVRGEYLDLIAQAPLDAVKAAWDIGAGTGVIAAILAKRGVTNIIATDNNPSAIACATDNMKRLGVAAQVAVQQGDMFPQGKADLVVCNPPWLPAKANAPIEHAVYDPDSQMLKAFLTGVKDHLNENGEAWLIMSDLAEHIGLRANGVLEQWIMEAGLQVVDTLTVAPRHQKASNRSDVLHMARSKESTALYRLQPIEQQQ